MSIVTDFKSIRQKLERQEQKVEFEEKNPKPNPVVWTPEWGYGAAPSPSAFNEAVRKCMAGHSRGFNLPNLPLVTAN